jgi:2-polyprenyl-6-methoxyphenol hydroxylase-like FAD-dependent oxidoreductase
MLGLLLARQGITVTVLEAHTDFDRDFRGDIVHPSTLELMDQLGLIDRVLRIPHAAIGLMPFHTQAGVVPFGAQPSLRSKYPNMLQLPQAQFLELLIAEAQRYPCFRLVLGARVDELIQEGGRIAGVRYRTRDGLHDLEACLTVGADGRFSKVRQLAGLDLVGDAQPIDYLWFRLPHLETDPPNAGGVYVGGGQVMVLLDRGAEWQVSYWLPKGGYQALRAAGLDTFQRSIARLAPWLAGRTLQLGDWTQAVLLAVQSSRARRWYRPGLLLIGDAAHVMLPVGGVGINMAIQDAVAAANLLGPRLARSDLRPRDLAALQRRREWPTRLVQGVQSLMQRQMLLAGEVDWAGPIRVPAVW